MSYEVRVSATAQRDLERIPPRIVSAIDESARRIDVLRVDHRSDVYRAG